MAVIFTNFSKITQFVKIYNKTIPKIPKTLLCHFNGANNSTTFTDDFGHTPLIHNSPKISTTQSKFGNSSLKLFQSDYIKYISSGNDFKFSNDFTVEFFVYFTSNSSYAIFDNRSAAGNGIILARSNNKIALHNSISWNYSSNTNLNQWYHIAVSRKASSLKLFVNGTTNIAITNNTNFTGGSCYIGGLYNSPSNGMIGYIDEFQIINGYAKYTSDFTPPLQQFPTVENIPN